MQPLSVFRPRKWGKVSKGFGGKDFQTAKNGREKGQGCCRAKPLDRAYDYTNLGNWFIWCICNASPPLDAPHVPRKTFKNVLAKPNNFRFKKRRSDDRLP